MTARVENVDQLAAALQALSDGDLTQTVAKPFLPTLEKLRIDFNATTVKLRNTMQSVSDNASAIAAGAQEIRSASDDLARRTEQQAAAVEETAAALEEITTTVADSSHRAQEAGELVRQTRENAERSARSCATPSMPWERSNAHPRKSPISSASSMKLPSRPICWR